MSVNLIAMLVSLAMMLTGAGGAVQPEALPVAETARTLTLSNVEVTWNGETVRLEPEAHIGVSTDGVRAVYDFGVDLGDQTLMPVQVAVDESGITALSGNSGVAVAVTDKALTELSKLMEEQMTASLGEAEGDGAQIMRFITEEYMPAYVNMLRVAMDPAQRSEINKVSQAVFDRVIDRGPGTPSTLAVDGEEYAVTAYSYTIDAAQMAALTDAMYGEVPVVKDYYDALFKLYTMMPEESGLRDIASFTDLFEKFNLQMRMDVEEQRSDDGAVDQMDTVLTMDLNGMMTMAQAQAAAEPAPEATDIPLEPVPEATDVPLEPAPEAGISADEVPADAQAEAEIPALEPFVMDIHSLKLNEYAEATGSCTYAVDEHQSFEISMTATESTGVEELEMTMTVSEDGKKAVGGKLSAFMAQDETGLVSYSVNMKAIQQDAAKVDATFYGLQNPDGTSENSVAIDVRTLEQKVGVSFDLNVTADPIVDAASAAEAACVIDDLSAEALQGLGQDPALMGALMQAVGSMTQDIAALRQDPGVKNLLTLFRGESLPIDVDELNEEDLDISVDFGGGPEGDEPAYELTLGDDADSDYELVAGEDGNYELVLGEDGTALDFDDGPVEDDGVLAFEMPEMTWLPKGWTVTATETDTAYDWVQLSVTDADGVECAYAIFFLDPEASTANYIVQEDGKVVDGRMINVTDFGEGGLSVTVSENGMYGNLMFTSEAIELDTIGQIIAGIQF